MSCNLNIAPLLRRASLPVYYDLYLRTPGDTLYPVPVKLLNLVENDDRSAANDKLVRRFFAADATTTRTGATSTPQVRGFKVGKMGVEAYRVCGWGKGRGHGDWGMGGGNGASWSGNPLPPMLRARELGGLPRHTSAGVREGALWVGAATSSSAAVLPPMQPAREREVQPRCRWADNTGGGTTTRTMWAVAQVIWDTMCVGGGGGGQGFVTGEARTRSEADPLPWHKRRKEKRAAPPLPYPLQAIRYIEEATLTVTLEPDLPSRILPPLLTIRYAQVRQRVLSRPHPIRHGNRSPHCSAAPAVERQAHPCRPLLYRPPRTFSQAVRSILVPSAPTSPPSRRAFYLLPHPHSSTTWAGLQPPPPNPPTNPPLPHSSPHFSATTPPLPWPALSPLPHFPLAPRRHWSSPMSVTAPLLPRQQLQRFPPPSGPSIQWTQTPPME